LTIKNNLININNTTREGLWQNQRAQKRTQILRKRKLELVVVNLPSGPAKEEAQMVQLLASFTERNIEDKANER